MSVHVISDNLHNRYLALWNLPLEFVWKDLVEWVLTILPAIGNPALERIVHTNESGIHVFWFKFKHRVDAIYFRGVVAARRISTDGPVLRCPFALPQDYAGANGRSTDFWDGELKCLSHDRPLTESFSPTQYCKPSRTSPALLERLNMLSLHNPDTYNKPSKSRRRRINRHTRMELEIIARMHVESIAPGVWHVYDAPP